MTSKSITLLRHSKTAVLTSHMFQDMQFSLASTIGMPAQYLSSRSVLGVYFRRQVGCHVSSLLLGPKRVHDAELLLHVDVLSRQQQQRLASAFG
jgi:hypothetical protein